MATKRRRVWVNEYDADDEGPGGLGDLAWQTKAAALASISSDGKAVAFVERLPGDVVRTKNEEVALESAIDRYTEAWETAYATHTDEARRAVTACGRNLRTLLRGRR